MATLDVYRDDDESKFWTGPQMQEAWDRGEQFKLFGGGLAVTKEEWKNTLYHTICVWWGPRLVNRHNIDVRASLQRSGVGPAASPPIKEGEEA